ncbi:hypothetical protein [Paenibacillus tarimensis]|uniref:hypothetical protein n=1 Tax=Paenibacillus tarimensis TaxID=416012 RepID=UPI001F38C54E|nr:hypothetical protein [Paenibacillus tarimensis]MCF2944369.1 hypothetical protein [Paenibacillus tarimensis]
MGFGFDFFLRVFKDRFNGEGDNTQLQFFLAEITELVKGTRHLTKIAELLIQYFHMILIERDIREEDGALLEQALIRLDDLCTESVNYAVYHDPGVLV